MHNTFPDDREPTMTPIWPGYRSGGGGFVLDRDVVRDMQREWEQLANDIASDQRLASYIITMGPPADEPASRYHAQTVQYSGQAFIVHSKKMWAVVNAYAVNLNNAIDAYLATDEAGQVLLKGGRP